MLLYKAQDAIRLKILRDVLIPYYPGWPQLQTHVGILKHKERAGGGVTTAAEIAVMCRLIMLPEAERNNKQIFL